MTIAQTLPVRTDLRAWAATAGLAASGVVIGLGNTNLKPGENGGTVPAIVTGAICLALAGALFGHFLPRVQRPAKAMLVLTVITVVTAVAWWSGVTPVLAAAMVTLRSESGLRSRASTIGVPVAVLLAAASVAVTIAGKI